MATKALRCAVRGVGARTIHQRHRITPNCDRCLWIAQAVVVGFAAGALSDSGPAAVDTAFAVWDEALAVISARAPRVSDSDDPDCPYLPPTPETGETVPGDLGAAFALAVLGGLF